MYLTILDYRTGRILINKYDPKELEGIDAEEEVTEKLGHSDFHYMCSNELIMLVNEDFQ